ncbi:SWI5-dependent HO expression protein 4 [Cystobasidiomycetes sp. EMM_F5]
MEAAMQTLDLSEPSVISKDLIKAKLVLLSRPLESQRQEVSAAYAWLARLLLPADRNGAPLRQEYLAILADIVESWLKEADLPDFDTAFGALSAILQVDVSSFTSITQRNGLEDNLVDAAETVQSDFKLVNEAERDSAISSLTCLIARAAGYKATRPLAQRMATVNSSGWLERQFRNALTPSVTRTASAVALIKFKSMSTASEQEQSQISQTATSDDLIALFSQVLQKNGITSPVATETSLALEGLALLSLNVDARRHIVESPSLLKTLITSSAKVGEDVPFSLATTLSQLLAYHRATNDDEERMKERLQKYANSAYNSAQSVAEVESEAEVDGRCQKFLQLGIMEAVNMFVKHPSTAVRHQAANILLSLVDKRERRGLVIQQGGAKNLLNVIGRQQALNTQGGQPTREDLICVQSLAKLLITTNPILVVGPSANSPLLVGVITPLSLPVTSPAASLLQQFESLMALTNIASVSDTLQEQIASLPTFLGRLEDIMLDVGSGSESTSDAVDGRILCRRAACELLCNLVGCETAFLRYTAADQEDKLRYGTLPAAVASRIKLLVALCSVEDLQTQLAVLGLMATLLSAPTVTRYIAAEDKRLDVFVSACEDADPGIQLRAIECVRQVAHTVPQKKDRIVYALRTCAARLSADESVKENAQEALRSLK